MHFELVTYRWGEEFVGGAELHHQRLATELADAGHKVTITTTDGGAIEPFCHWGVRWKRRESTVENPRFPVTRHKLRSRPTWMMALGAKCLQRRIEAEGAHWTGEVEGRLSRVLGEGMAPHLVSGWHHHELEGSEVRRWCSRRATIAVFLPGNRGGKLFVGGNLPKANSVVARIDGITVAQFRFNPGHCLIEVPLEGGFKGIVELEFSNGWRPLRDFRTLTVYTDSVVVQDDDGVNHAADLTRDFRALLRPLGGEWEDMLVSVAGARPPIYNKMMDFLRGPVVPASMYRQSMEPGRIRILCNMPWATVSQAGPRDVVMGLWHIDDDFYAWSHWIDALRRCRFVLANSPYTARESFPRLGIRSHFVGPPIWEPDHRPDEETTRALREMTGLQEGEKLVLTVCRKSPEKGYEAVARAVSELRERGVKVRFAGIGPDDDRRPFQHEGCVWLGKRSWEELQAAYALCDVFALMSESESFGMVIPEAWHHGRAVVVNRLCGPAASLIEEGVDGMLAGSRVELTAVLADLLSDDGMRMRLGSAGLSKARRDFTRGAAGRRLLEALEEL